MKRLFGEYGLIVAITVISLSFLVILVSGQNNGLLGANGVGRIPPKQTTTSINNNDMIISLYKHKDPVLEITPTTLTRGNSYNFYTDFTTTALEYQEDGTTKAIRDRIDIEKMTLLQRTNMSDIEATRTDIDIHSSDFSAYQLSTRGVLEVTYCLTDSLGFKTTKTYQFPVN